MFSAGLRLPPSLREDERTKTTPVCGLSHRLIDVVVFRGIFSIIQDPTGSILGLWKADPKMMHAAGRKDVVVCPQARG